MKEDKTLEELIKCLGCIDVQYVNKFPSRKMLIQFKR